MKSAGALVADFECGLAAEALFDGALHCWTYWAADGVECGEADDGRPEHGGIEIKLVMHGMKASLWLVSGKHDGNVVELVAPCVHVDGRVEDAVSRAQHQARRGMLVRDAKRGAKCVLLV